MKTYLFPLLKRVVALLVMLPMVLGLLPAAPTALGLQPNATIVADVYEIGSTEQLIEFANLVSRGNTTLNAVLTADLDLNPGYTFCDDGTVLYNGTAVTSGWRTFYPIGSYSYPFNGVFDGNGKTIRGLYINITNDREYAGLFGYTKYDAEIKNLTISNSRIQAIRIAGSIMGYGSGSITNCHSDASVYCASDIAGGIAGYSSGVIKDCTNKGPIVAGSTYAGGIAGSGSSITNCRNEGSVISYGHSSGISNASSIRNCTNTGKIIAYEGTNSYEISASGITAMGNYVFNCVNTGTITSTKNASGIACSNYGTINICANYGDVSGETKAAGISSYNLGGTVVNCLNVGTVIGQNTYVGGIVGSNVDITDYPFALIDRCVNLGTVIGGGGLTGAIAGENEQGSIVTDCYYLQDTATDGAGTIQCGIGNTQPGTFTADKERCSTAMTREQFSSGEVAYLLQLSQPFYSNCGRISLWGQQLGVDWYPTLCDAMVCRTDDGFTNSVHQTHTFNENGFCTACPAVFQPAQDSDGDGFFEIDNAGKLYWFAAQVNSGNSGLNGILTADVNLNPGFHFAADGSVIRNDDATSPVLRHWYPIASGEFTYTGTFDGNGKSISGMFIRNLRSGSIGVFSVVDDDGIVKDLQVKDSLVNGYSCVGTVVGINHGTVTGCRSSANNIIGNYRIGGIAGMNYGTVSGCVNESTIYSDGYNRNLIGGIVGYNYLGVVSDCMNLGEILADGNENGGIVGYNEGKVLRCGNEGNLTTDGYLAGGVVGINLDAVENCYSHGTIISKDKLHSIVSRNEGVVRNCYVYDVSDTNTMPTGAIGKNYGIVSNCFYLASELHDDNSDVPIGTIIPCTAEDFASGKVLDLLQFQQTPDADGNIPQVWGQALGVDKMPKLGGKPVYRQDGGFYNSDLPHTHSFGSHGFCETCTAGIEPAIDSDGDEFYEIRNIGNLMWFLSKAHSSEVPLNGRLMANVDVNPGFVFNENNVECNLPEGQLPALRYWNPPESFGGIFDGNGYAIRGVYCCRINSRITGTFITVTETGVIQNLTIENAILLGRDTTGGIAGYNKGLISNCCFDGYVKNDSSSPSSDAGGIAGQNLGTIDRCHNKGTIVGDDYVGGIVGCIGGMGHTDMPCRITNSYNTGSVQGKGNCTVGGIVGLTNFGHIENCLNIGPVTSTSKTVGSVIGGKYHDTISNCLYLIGCAIDGNGTVQNGTYGSNGSPTADQEGVYLGLTEEQMRSGMGAYLLQAAQPGGQQVWGQRIGIDEHPVLSSEIVYCGYQGCIPDQYANEPLADTPVHTVSLIPAKNPTCAEPGNKAYYLCAGCGKLFKDYQAQTETTAENEMISPTGNHIFSAENHRCTCGLLDPAVGGATLTGFSLSFESEIQVNLYYTVDNPTYFVEHGLLVFHDTAETVDISNADQIFVGSGICGENGYYFNCTDGIPAKAMGDNRNYAVYLKLADGSYVYSEPKTYSPKQYVLSRLEKSSNDKLKALCVAMLNYGAAAQQQFGYRTDDLMNSGLTDAQQALVADYASELFVGALPADSSKCSNFPKTVPGFSKRSASVSFEGAFAINYYFTPNTVVDGQITFCYWSAEDYASAESLTPANATGQMIMIANTDGSYWTQLQDIPAKDLDQTFYVAAYYTGDNQFCCTGVISYSISKYCMNAVNANNSMVALAKATAMYGYYANAYFNS